jgi:DNA-binding beta-propeller fold protein YncE
MPVGAKCTLDGEEVMRLGTPPRPDIYTAEKRFVPTESAVASNGDIYVTDGYGQHWVHRYTKDGEYVSSFGNPGGTEDGRLRNPHGIMIDTRSGTEYVLISDRANNRLQYFTLEGEYVKQVHHDLRLPCTTVQWRDEIYVPDLQSRLTVFDKDDNLILHLGDRPDCWKKEGWPNIPKEDWVVGAFSSPHDMHVDSAGNIYVAEWLSNGTGKCTKLIRQG